MKKKPGDIIILHMCSINDNHTMYDSWDMEHNRQNFLSFWIIFCPTMDPENQNFGKMKKTPEDISFYKCVPQMTVTCSMVPEIWNAMDKFFCHFGPYFSILPP